ncbi:hypothetical protein SMD44_08959 [Streptomyces alboflavus]|uniref:Uncharacterized protein n=1 Tax=Streptomyces alboflavus TaxID=67267 RepID=A0A1Z1WSZ2_9ACTN|nr:hypothetical protein [Streptomyces alboflavus]ARX89472.1 hypothetical protein SMD44_08959 [Streptomyces alboflavus]
MRFSQRDRLPLGGLVVGGFQVVGEDPPGHGVDDQVVDQEEVDGAVGVRGEQGRPQQRSVAEVEAGVQVVGGLLHGRVGLLCRQAREVVPVQEALGVVAVGRGWLNWCHPSASR